MKPRPLPTDKVTWFVANDGTGARRWFVTRHGNPPTYLETKAGKLRKFGSSSAAQRAADQLNPPDIEADYPELHLTALSDSVVSDLTAYFQKEEIYAVRDDVADFLSEKARKVYATESNGHFRKGLKPTKRAPDRHRDQLLVWFQHWICSFLQEKGLLTRDESQHLVNVRWSVGESFVHPTYDAYKKARGY